MNFTLLRKIELANSKLTEFQSNNYYNKDSCNDDTYELLLNKNELVNVKISNFINLKQIIINNNDLLESIEIENCPNLYLLDISNCKKINNIKGLDTPNLGVLVCHNTDINFINEKYNINLYVEKDNEKINYIIDNIYLGNCGHSEEELLELGISHIFNITPQTYRQYSSIIEYQLPIHDALDQNISDLFPEVLNKIKDLIDAGKKIYVHCYAGVSRSASLVILYIMIFYRKTFEESFRYVREKRFCVQPNPYFVQQLKEMETVIINFKE
jgi:hypothetical protein